MKKTLYLLFIVCLVLLCFSSCAFFGGEHSFGDSENHTEHTFEYIAYESGHFKQFTCGCPSPEIMGMHFDDNSDGICDLCNYKMSNGELIPDDNQNDSNKDPGNSKFPTEPDNSTIYLSDKWTFLKTATVDQVVEIETMIMNLDAKAGSLKVFRTTTDKAVIERLLSDYKILRMHVTDEKPLEHNSQEFLITFKFANGHRYNIRIYDGIFSERLKGELTHYKLSSLPQIEKKDDHVESYGFISSYKTALIFSDYSMLSSRFYMKNICHIPLDEIRFVIGAEDTSADKSWHAQSLIYGIQMDFDSLIFTNPDNFYYNSYENGIQAHCTLIGKNINEFIAEYAPKDTDVFLSDYEPWLKEITAGDVTKIKTYSFDGVTYEELQYILSTTHKTYISQMIDDYNLITLDKDDIVDYDIPSGRFEIEFYLTDGSVKRIVFQGGGHFYNGYPVSVTPTLARDKFREVVCGFSCVPYEKPTTLYMTADGGDVALGVIDPSMLEFKVCQSNCSVPSSPKYYFDVSIGRIEIYDETHLKLNGEIYKIINWDFANFDNILTVKQSYEEHYNDGRVATVERYYGTTALGGIAALITDSYSDYTQATHKETVGGYTFHYSYGNSIVVFYEDEFYGLQQAYENGYISDIDLLSIYKLN